MPLLSDLQSDEIKDALNTKLMNLRAEFRGRSVDENDDAVTELETIHSLISDAKKYKDKKKLGLTNGVIIERLLHHQIISDIRAIQLRMRLSGKHLKSGDMSPHI